MVTKFVDHYNQVRLHSAIGYIILQDKLLGREKQILRARDHKLAQARKQRQRRRADRKQAVDRVRSQSRCSWRQATGYNTDAKAEDRAMLGSNPSADLGPEAKDQFPTSPHFAFGTSDKLQGVWGKIPQGTENQPLFTFDATPADRLNSSIEKSVSR